MKKFYNLGGQVFSQRGPYNMRWKARILHGELIYWIKTLKLLLGGGGEGGLF